MGPSVEKICTDMVYLFLTDRYRKRRLRVMNDRKITHALEEAAHFFGSEAALARALGVSRGAVNQWKKPKRQVPAEYAPKIEKLTGVRSERLCPSVDWAAIRNASMPQSSPRAKAAEEPARV